MFNNCTSLCTFSFPESLKLICSYAFVNTALETIDLPNTVSIIERYAFQNCQYLQTFTIPEGSDLETIETGVFSGCRDLREIINKGEHFTSWNSALFDYNKTELIVLPPACGVKYFYFPDSVQTIRKGACEGIISLEVVFIPPSITNIQSEAFKSCTHLRIINIPLNTTVGKNCFENCPRLQCGLAIENETQSFRENLTSISKLPKKCLHSCINTCKDNQYSDIISHISLFYIIIGYTSH